MYDSVYILDKIFINIFIYFPRENLFWYFRRGYDTMYFVEFDKRYGKQSIFQVHTSCRTYS